MDWITIAGLITLVLIGAVGTEAYVKRNRKKRSFVETFKGDAAEGDEGVPLGMEATDFDVLKAEEQKARNSGLLHYTGTLAKIRKK